MADILERIDAAIERITSGHAPMRVPADETDPDLVLSDCREQISELRTALFRERASVPPVGERERRIAETIQDYLDCYDEADRCFGCDNDAGREHAEDCTEAPRIKEARAWADSILSSPAPDPAASHEPAEPADPERIYPCADCGVMRTKAEGGTTFTVCDECWDKHNGKAAPDPASGPRASIELGSCKDDDDCYTFIVALANTEEDENRDEEAPILYSGEYPTEADRDEAASRVAAALGLQVKESR